MKALIFIASAFLSLTFLAAAAQDARQTRTISGVKRLKARMGVEVFVKLGTDESLHIDARGVREDQIVVEQNGDELTLSLKLEGVYEMRNNRKYVKAYLTVRQLQAVDAGSGASVTGESSFEAPAFTVESKAGASVSLDVKARDVTIDAGSGATATLSGTASSVSASAGAGASVNADKLIAETVDANASAGASVRINAQKELFGKASTGGSVSNRGPGRIVSKRTSLGGSVN